MRTEDKAGDIGEVGEDGHEGREVPNWKILLTTGEALALAVGPAGEVA